jgi:hypothetical protein
MAKKSSVAAHGSPPVEPKDRKSPALSRTPFRARSLLDTRVAYCGDNLEQLAKLPDACVDLSREGIHSTNRKFSLHFRQRISFRPGISILHVLPHPGLLPAEKENRPPFP